MASASDNFNRANETPIAAPWTLSGSGSVNLASNRMTSVSSAERIIYYAGSVSDPDQFSQATIADRSGTSNDWGPAVRCSSGPNAYWAAGYDPGSSLETYKVVSGSYSSIGSKAKPANFVNGQVIRCEAEGTTIRYYIDGTLFDTHTDSSLTGAGSGAGVFFYDAAMDIDDWSGGDLGGGGTPQLLAAVIGSTSLIVANLRVGKPLSASIQGTSTVGAALRATKTLAASISSTSSVAASLSTAGAKLLAASISSASSVTASLRATKAMAASIASTSTISASLRATKQLAASISGTSSVAASLAVPKRLAATIASTSAVGAALRVGKPLAASISSTSSVVARLFVGGAVAATGRVYQSLQMIRTRIGW